MNPMKRNIFLNVLLIFIFICIFMVEVAIFISAPAQIYDYRILQKIKEIECLNDQTFDYVERHVFQIITYIAYTESSIIWYNEQGEELYRIAKDHLQWEEVTRIVKDHYQIEDAQIRLGYGVEEAIYDIQSKEYHIQLSIHDLTQQYYRKKELYG